MYLRFFNLKEMPFRLAPDPRFMYWSAGHSAALACIRAVRQAGAGCAAIVGERGTGKTGLLEYLGRQPDAHAALRIDFPPRTLSELLEWRHDSDVDDAGGGRIILCDNAHLFHESMLAALVRGAVTTLAGAPADCVVLAGEAALARRLDTPQFAAQEALRFERFELPSLTAAETAAFIGHRLTVAGAGGRRIFRDEACADVHRETRGLPRLVNALCDAAMMVACERELPEVGAAEVRRALDDLGRLATLQAAESCEPRVPIDDPAGPARRAFARLRLLLGEQLIVDRELACGQLSIGRSADNDLCIDSRFVSRRHCRIVTSERRCVIEEVRSTNGIYVNDRRVRRHRMRDGDVVKIGEHRLHYQDLRGSAPGD